MPTRMARALLVECLGVMAGGLGGCATASQAPAAAVSADSSLGELEKACEGGDVADACASLGFKYMEGEGVAKDPSRAAALLERACTAGRALACSGLGLSYASGNGVAKDRTRAARLFEQACGANEAMGCHWRGLALLNGSGVAKDEQGSIQFFEQACEGGYPPACDLLARFHRDGRWVPKDPSRAAALFEKACRGGESDACQAGAVTAGSILIFSGPSMIPSFADPGIGKIWFSFSSKVAEELREELVRGGIPAQLFLGTDPGQSARQMFIKQLAIHPYDEVIQIGVEHVKEGEGATVYLVLESFLLQSAPSTDGSRHVTTRGGTSKRYPVLSSSGKDMRDASTTSLAEDFARAFRAGRSAR
jgi:TPR repeat protein